MTHTLLICDKDSAYARKLSEYINFRSGFPFEVRYICDDARVKHVLEEWNVEVVLATEAFREKLLVYIDEDRIITLSSNGGNKDKGCIYKYQSCESIIKQLLQIIAKMKGIKNLANRKNTMKILGFYSPVGRSLQTSLSLVMGQLLAGKGKTLYINMESYSGLGELLRTKFSNDMTDVMYEICENDNAMPAVIGASAYHLGKLDVLPPMKNHLDLSSISYSEWKEFFERLENGTDYEYIILDLSEGVQNLVDILRLCKKIYMTVESDKVAQSKINQFFENLDESQREYISNKVIKCDAKQMVDIGAVSISALNGPLGEFCRKLMVQE